MVYKFYDTCSLLLNVHHLWEDQCRIVISSITLEEIENIKTSANKDIDIKFAARELINELDKHFGEYIVVFWDESFWINSIGIDLHKNNDAKIIMCANNFYNSLDPEDEMTFITNDIFCKELAHLILTCDIDSYKEEEYNYDGYKEIIMNEDEMIQFYSSQSNNLYNLNTNEYLIIKDKDQNVVDKLCWTGDTYRPLTYNNFKSEYFGNVKPIKGDIYQALAADSLENNKITLIKGPAGTGKTYLSLGFLLHKLERNKIDKIIVFCNTVATKNSAKLGYYPGSRDEKLLDSQIGNLLSSKLGGRIAVEQMMQKEELVLLPLSDIRGYDTSGMRAGIYISEAQNLDIELMKLALQRIGEDCICIIDGDNNAQVDDIHFSGNSNGMKRASQVFRNTDIYGEITLKNIHRSRIANLAQNM